MPERYASIDVGSNTVKLTICGLDGAGCCVPMVDTSQTSRLGEGMHAGRLREDAIRRTLDALRYYVALCAEHEVQSVRAVGTAALRNAANRDEFVARAADAGVDVHIISGEEEARLSFLAVRRDRHWRDADRLLVVDIGGGSTEVVIGSPDHRVSFPMGAVRLTEAALLSDPPTIGQMAEASRLAQEAIAALHLQPGPWTAVGVGGTLVNMAAVRLGVAEHDPDALHGMLLCAPDVEEQVALYAAHTLAQRKQIVGLDPARADVILGGALILSQVLAALGLPAIAVSCRGLRWGVLYEMVG